MSEDVLNIIEFFLFFVTFAVIFQAFNAIRIDQIFRKGKIWQIQIIYILSTVIFSYLAVQAFMKLIYLSTEIFS